MTAQEKLKKSSAELTEWIEKITADVPEPAPEVTEKNIKKILEMVEKKRSQE